MKRLSPHDLIKHNSYVGYRRGAVIAMAEHYGFVRTNDGKDAKHLVFTHRDYHDLRFNLKSESGDVGWTYLENIVTLCMEVKRRNALRKEPVFSEIPEWVFKALPSGSRITNEDNRVAFESGAVLDLDASEMPPVRHYLLSLRDKTLTIRSDDYPSDAFTATFNVKDGSANTGGLKAMFDMLDAKVLAHTHEMAGRFNDNIQRLVANHGFFIHEEQNDFDVPRWVLTHPVYGSEDSFPVPKQGQAIADATIAQLDSILEKSREAALAQMEWVEGLAARGWRVVPHAANGQARHYEFSHTSGRSFDMPVYGMNNIFDEAAARSKLEALEKSEQVEPVEEVKAKPSSPVTGSTVIDGAKIRAGLLARKPKLGIAGGGAAGE